MKFHLEQLEGLNRFTAHGPGFVEVNGERVNENVLVGGSVLARGWAQGPATALTSHAVASLPPLQPEVVLLGTGTRLQFPPREALVSLQAHGVGVEVMDTPAACRTYNILLSEGRRVLAALIVE